MSSNLYNNTFSHRQETHAEKQIRARESAKLLKEEVFAELSIENKAELIFEALPCKAERTALAIIIKNASCLQDIRDGFEDSKAFSTINDSSTVSGASSLTSSLHALIDDFEEFIAIATHPDSQDGQKLSQHESSLSEKLLMNMNDFISDLNIFIKSRKA